MDNPISAPGGAVADQFARTSAKRLRDNRNFNIFWFGQTLSNLGDAVALMTGRTRIPRACRLASVSCSFGAFTASRRRCRSADRANASRCLSRWRKDRFAATGRTLRHVRRYRRTRTKCLSHVPWHWTRAHHEDAGSKHPQRHTREPAHSSCRARRQRNALWTAGCSILDRAF